MIGCGTSWFVAQAYAALRERAGLGETDAVCASEFAAGRALRPGRRVHPLRHHHRGARRAARRRRPATRAVAVTAVAGDAGRRPVDERAGARLRRRAQRRADPLPDHGAGAGPRGVRRATSAACRRRPRAALAGRAAGRPGRRRPPRLPRHRLDRRAGPRGRAEGPRGRPGLVGVLPGDGLPARPDGRRPARAAWSGSFGALPAGMADTVARDRRPAAPRRPRPARRARPGPALRARARRPPRPRPRPAPAAHPIGDPAARRSADPALDTGTPPTTSR